MINARNSDHTRYCEDYLQASANETPGQTAERFHILGLAQLEKNRVALGIKLLHRSIEVKGDEAAVYFNLGNALCKINSLDEAIASFETALEIDASFTAARYNRAYVLVRLKRFDDALVDYNLVLLAQPEHAKAHLNRGNVLRELNRPQDALNSYERSLALMPTDPEALCGYGAALHDLGRYEEAVQRYTSALQLRPEYVDALSNRGASLRRLYRHTEALNDYECALTINPGNIATLVNKGNALRELCQVEEALHCFLAVQAIDPMCNEAHMGEFYCRHLLGEMKTSWEKYEWRRKDDQSPLARRQFSAPLWLGNFDVKGKVILLHAEQGFGDIIQFSRYSKLVSRLGAKVILEVPLAMERLLGKLEGVDQLIVRGAPLPHIDCQCPLMSLPLALGTTQESVPCDGPYLHCPQKIREAWRNRLVSGKGRRVGVAWSGNPAHDNDINRSISLQDFSELFSPAAQFCCLQKEIREGDLTVLRDIATVPSFCNNLTDFMETAGLIANMDLVVSVDTSVAHLAAAMGKPTWILLPFNVEWRWLLDRSDSPWYPTVRLFRQSIPGDWRHVITSVAHELLT